MGTRTRRRDMLIDRPQSVAMIIYTCSRAMRERRTRRRKGELRRQRIELDSEDIEPWSFQHVGACAGSVPFVYTETAEVTLYSMITQALAWPNHLTSVPNTILYSGGRMGGTRKGRSTSKPLS
jgi:hypothetical protein